MFIIIGWKNRKHKLTPYNVLYYPRGFKIQENTRKQLNVLFLFLLK